MDLDPMQIGGAVLLIAMLGAMGPTAFHRLKNSPKAEAGDWAGIVLPAIAVILFVILLMNIV